MKRLFFALLVSLFALPAFATIPTILPRDCTFFSGISAAADHNSNDAAAFGKAFDLSGFRQASFQVNWTGLTGTINGAVKLQVTNFPTCSTCWVDKSGATFTLAGAAGSDMIVLVGSVAEAFYRLHYDHGGISAGTLTGACSAKE